LEGSILAGGEGRRMRAITAHLAKPLLYLPGGTLLEHQLALLSRQRLGRICVVTRHKGRQIQRAVRGVSGLTTLRQEPPHTLLGAIATALGSAREPCIVLHGDNYFSHRLEYLAEAVHEHFLDQRCQALFATDPKLAQEDSAEILSASGCYVLSPELLPVVRELIESDQLSSLTRALLDEGVGVRRVPLRGWRQNINEAADLLATNRRILEDWPGTFHLPGAEAGCRRQGSSFGAEGPVWVSPQAVVVDSSLGSFTTVGSGATVRGSNLVEVIVFPRAEVVNQELSRSLVLPGPEGCLVLSADGDIGRDDEGYP